MHHSNITENCSKSFTLVKQNSFYSSDNWFFPLWYLTLLPLIIKSCSYFCQLSSYFWFCDLCVSAALQLFPSQAVGGAAEAFESLLRILGPEAALESIIQAVSLSQET